MIIERQYALPRFPTTIEDLMIKEKSDAPVVVLQKKQAILMFRGLPDREDISGVPIAKPWTTSYRGEVFVYIPVQSNKSDISLPLYKFIEKPVGNGLVGIANLRSIAYIETEAEWEETFPLHCEKGNKPFERTYLWFLHSVRQFNHPLQITIKGKWVSDEEVYKEPLSFSHMSRLILPPEERILHSVSLFGILQQI